MTYARRTDTPHKAIVEALRAHGCGVVDMSRVAGGFPDLLLHAWGQTGLLEIKDGNKPPSQQKKTEKQIKFWNTWKGGPIGMANDVESALRFYNLMVSGLKSTMARDSNPNTSLSRVGVQTESAKRHL